MGRRREMSPRRQEGAGGDGVGVRVLGGRNMFKAIHGFTSRRKTACYSSHKTHSHVSSSPSPSYIPTPHDYSFLLREFLFLTLLLFLLQLLPLNEGGGFGIFRSGGGVDVFCGVTHARAAVLQHNKLNHRDAEKVPVAVEKNGASPHSLPLRPPVPPYLDEDRYRHRRHRNHNDDLRNEAKHHRNGGDAKYFRDRRGEREREQAWELEVDAEDDGRFRPQQDELLQQPPQHLPPQNPPQQPPHQPPQQPPQQTPPVTTATTSPPPTATGSGSSSTSSSSSSSPTSSGGGLGMNAVASPTTRRLATALQPSLLLCADPLRFERLDTAAYYQTPSTLSSSSSSSSDIPNDDNPPYSTSSGGGTASSPSSSSSFSSSSSAFLVTLLGHHPSLLEALKTFAVTANTTANNNNNMPPSSGGAFQYTPPFPSDAFEPALLATTICRAWRGVTTSAAAAADAGNSGDDKSHTTFSSPSTGNSNPTTSSFGSASASFTSPAASTTTAPAVATNASQQPTLADLEDALQSYFDSVLTPSDPVHNMTCLRLRLRAVVRNGTSATVNGTTNTTPVGAYNSSSSSSSSSLAAMAAMWEVFSPSAVALGDIQLVVSFQQAYRWQMVEEAAPPPPSNVSSSSSSSAIAAAASSSSSSSTSPSSRYFSTVKPIRIGVLGVGLRPDGDADDDRGDRRDGNNNGNGGGERREDDTSTALSDNSSDGSDGGAGGSRRGGARGGGGRGVFGGAHPRSLVTLDGIRLAAMQHNRAIYYRGPSSSIRNRRDYGRRQEGEGGLLSGATMVCTPIAEHMGGGAASSQQQQQQQSPSSSNSPAPASAVSLFLSRVSITGLLGGSGGTVTYQPSSYESRDGAGRGGNAPGPPVPQPFPSAVNGSDKSENNNNDNNQRNSLDDQTKSAAAAAEDRLLVRGSRPWRSSRLVVRPIEVVPIDTAGVSIAIAKQLWHIRSLLRTRLFQQFATAASSPSALASAANGSTSSSSASSSSSTLLTQRLAAVIAAFVEEQKPPLVAFVAASVQEAIHNATRRSPITQSMTRGLTTNTSNTFNHTGADKYREEYNEDRQGGGVDVLTGDATIELLGEAAIQSMGLWPSASSATATPPGIPHSVNLLIEGLLNRTMNIVVSGGGLSTDVAAGLIRAAENENTLLFGPLTTERYFYAPEAFSTHVALTAPSPDVQLESLITYIASVFAIRRVALIGTPGAANAVKAPMEAALASVGMTSVGFFCLSDASAASSPSSSSTSSAFATTSSPSSAATPSQDSSGIFLNNCPPGSVTGPSEADMARQAALLKVQAVIYLNSGGSDISVAVDRQLQRLMESLLTTLPPSLIIATPFINSLSIASIVGKLPLSQRPQHRIVTSLYGPLATNTDRLVIRRYHEALRQAVAASTSYSSTAVKDQTSQQQRPPKLSPILRFDPADLASEPELSALSVVGYVTGRAIVDVLRRIAPGLIDAESIRRTVFERRLLPADDMFFGPYSPPCLASTGIGVRRRGRSRGGSRGGSGGSTGRSTNDDDDPSFCQCNSGSRRVKIAVYNQQMQLEVLSFAETLGEQEDISSTPGSSAALEKSASSSSPPYFIEGAIACSGLGGIEPRAPFVQIAVSPASASTGISATTLQLQRATEQFLRGRAVTRATRRNPLLTVMRTRKYTTAEELLQIHKDVTALLSPGSVLPPPAATSSASTTTSAPVSQRQMVISLDPIYRVPMLSAPFVPEVSSSSSSSSMIFPNTARPAPADVRVLHICPTLEQEIHAMVAMLAAPTTTPLSDSAPSAAESVGRNRTDDSVGVPLPEFILLAGSNDELHTRNVATAMHRSIQTFFSSSSSSSSSGSQSGYASSSSAQQLQHPQLHIVARTNVASALHAVRNDPHMLIADIDGGGSRNFLIHGIATASDIYAIRDLVDASATEAERRLRQQQIEQLQQQRGQKDGAPQTQNNNNNQQQQQQGGGGGGSSGGDEPPLPPPSPAAVAALMPRIFLPFDHVRVWYDLIVKILKAPEQQRQIFFVSSLPSWNPLANHSSGLKDLLADYHEGIAKNAAAASGSSASTTPSSSTSPEMIHFPSPQSLLGYLSEMFIGMVAERMQNTPNEEAFYAALRDVGLVTLAPTYAIGPFFTRPCDMFDRDDLRGENCEVMSGARHMSLFSMEAVTSRSPAIAVPAARVRFASSSPQYALATPPVQPPTNDDDSLEASRNRLRMSIIGAAVTAFVCLVVAVVALLVFRSFYVRRSTRFAPVDPKRPFTIVFTSIQSSTALWADVPDAMGLATKLHNALVRRLMTQFEGYEVKLVGDLFMIAFRRADAAVQFAMTLQQQLFALGLSLDGQCRGRCELLRGEGGRGDVSRRNRRDGGGRRGAAAGAGGCAHADDGYGVISGSLRGERGGSAGSSRSAKNNTNKREGGGGGEEEASCYIRAAIIGSAVGAGGNTTTTADTMAVIDAAYRRLETVHTNEVMARTRCEDPTMDPALINLSIHLPSTDEYQRLWHGLRVRVGIHTGFGDIQKDPVTGGYDYFGTVVNTAAGIEAAASGGQVIISDATMADLRMLRIESDGDHFSATFAPAAGHHAAAAGAGGSLAASATGALWSPQDYHSDTDAEEEFEDDRSDQERSYEGEGGAARGDAHYHHHHHHDNPSHREMDGADASNSNDKKKRRRARAVAREVVLLGAEEVHLTSVLQADAAAAAAEEMQEKRNEGEGRKKGKRQNHHNHHHQQQPQPQRDGGDPSSFTFSISATSATTTTTTSPTHHRNNNASIHTTLSASSLASLAAAGGGAGGATMVNGRGGDEEDHKNTTTTTTAGVFRGQQELLPPRGRTLLGRSSARNSKRDTRGAYDRGGNGGFGGCFGGVPSILSAECLGPVPLIGALVDSVLLYSIHISSDFLFSQSGSGGSEKSAGGDSDSVGDDVNDTSSSSFVCVYSRRYPPIQERERQQPQPQQWAVTTTTPPQFQQPPHHQHQQHHQQQRLPYPSRLQQPHPTYSPHHHYYPAAASSTVAIAPQTAATLCAATPPPATSMSSTAQRNHHRSNSNNHPPRPHHHPHHHHHDQYQQAHHPLAHLQPHPQQQHPEEPLRSNSTSQRPMSMTSSTTTTTTTAMTRPSQSQHHQQHQWRVLDGGSVGAGGGGGGAALPTPGSLPSPPPLWYTSSLPQPPPPPPSAPAVFMVAEAPVAAAAAEGRGGAEGEVVAAAASSSLLPAAAGVAAGGGGLPPLRPFFSEDGDNELSAGGSTGFQTPMRTSASCATGGGHTDGFFQEEQANNFASSTAAATADLTVPATTCDDAIAAHDATEGGVVKRGGRGGGGGGGVIPPLLSVSVAPPAATAPAVESATITKRWNVNAPLRGSSGELLERRQQQQEQHHQEHQQGHPCEMHHRDPLNGTVGVSRTGIQGEQQPQQQQQRFIRVAAVATTSSERSLVHYHHHHHHHYDHQHHHQHKNGLGCPTMGINSVGNSDDRGAVRAMPASGADADEGADVVTTIADSPALVVVANLLSPLEHSSSSSSSSSLAGDDVDSDSDDGSSFFGSDGFGGHAR